MQKCRKKVPKLVDTLIKIIQMTNIQYNPKEKYPNERSITKFRSETKDKKKSAALPPTTLATRLKPRLYKKIYAHLWWRSMQATGRKPTSSTGLKVAISLA